MANPTPQEINRILSAKDRASAAADYAETIVIETEQIQGNVYQGIWSAAYAGPFVPDAET